MSAGAVCGEEDDAVGAGEDVLDVGEEVPLVVADEGCNGDVSSLGGPFVGKEEVVEELALVDEYVADVCVEAEVAQVLDFDGGHHGAVVRLDDAGA